MQIAIASGKGGTGKTTLSVALAQAAGEPVTLLDCDVEEPNAALFLHPESCGNAAVSVPVPTIDPTRCTHCGRCGEVCRFNALAAAGSHVLVFPELCHSCGGCALACPAGAIEEEELAIGTLRFGSSENIYLIEGRLDIGRAMAPPLIRAARKAERQGELTLIDCPPGTSCPMITAAKGADFAILVTEPTPFGLHDLRLAVDTIRKLSIPFGVIVNRSDAGDDRVVRYCEEEEIRLLLQISESRKIAENYSRGKSILAAEPELKARLRNLLETIR